MILNLKKKVKEVGLPEESFRRLEAYFEDVQTKPPNKPHLVWSPHGGHRNAIAPDTSVSEAGSNSSYLESIVLASSVRHKQVCQ